MAWPGPGVLDTGEMERLTAGHALVVNFEGALIHAAPEACQVEDVYKYNLYSHSSSMDTLKALNTVACGLANNHICDYKSGLDHTLAALNVAGIQAFGTRRQPWCQITVDGRPYLLWAACSPLPEPTAMPGTADAAQLFEPEASLQQLSALRREFPAATLVAFMHWGYELARHPQPADREWARRAIDVGVSLVIGHHPHLVQGLERHGDGVIAYSLGNFALPQVNYRGRELRYKSESVCEQLVLRHSAAGLRSVWVRYDKARARLLVEREHDALTDPELAARTPFAGLSDQDYRAWFAEETRAERRSGRKSGPTMWSYRGVAGIEGRIKCGLMGWRKRVRRLAIRAGLHKPYNW